MFASTKDNKMSAAKDGMVNEGGHPVEDIKEKARHFRSEAQDAATAVKDDLEGVARRTGEHMREVADSAGNSLSDIGQAMTLKIREKPVQSSVIAVVVGVVIGMLFSRR